MDFFMGHFWKKNSHNKFLNGFRSALFAEYVADFIYFSCRKAFILFLHENNLLSSWKMTSLSSTNQFSIYQWNEKIIQFFIMNDLANVFVFFGKSFFFISFEQLYSKVSASPTWFPCEFIFHPMYGIYVWVYLSMSIGNSVLHSVL